MAAVAPFHPVRARQDLIQALEGTAGLRRAHSLPVPPRPASSGIPALDALLDGGLPRGRIVELAGAPSTGRTGLALCAARAAIERGEVIAWVDVADALCPASTAALGLDLSRLLWARARSVRQALLAVDRILGAGGFGLVVVDLGTQTTGPAARLVRPEALLRLARQVERAGAVLLLLDERRRAGTLSALTLCTEREGARWQGQGPAPRLLLGVQGRIRVARNRSGTEGGSVTVSWDAGRVAT